MAVAAVEEDLRLSAAVKALPAERGKIFSY
jgi:hypothetical protein